MYKVLNNIKSYDLELYGRLKFLHKRVEEAHIHCYFNAIKSNLFIIGT